MKKIVLISCASQKLTYKAKVKDLYISSLFKKSLEYAKLLKPDRIFVLSAKYGLLDLEKEIEPYNVTLNDMSRKKRKNWTEMVVNQLTRITSLDKDKFIILAGKNYREFIVPHIMNYEIPMEHIGLFSQQSWLSREISNIKRENE